MGRGPYRYGQQQQPVQPPNVFFDGTRLGLEGSMLSTLVVAGLGGLHIGLSSVLGFLIRYEDGLPAEAKQFTFVSFLFISVLAMVALAMILFFGSAIPTMAYAMALVSGMLRWVGKRWPKVRLWSTIFGAVGGLLVGLALSTLGILLFNLEIGLALYARLISWPAVLSIDGIALMWLTFYPLISVVGGAQIGWRLGKQLDDLSLYWFW
jgi:hypothetical protein